MQATSLRLPRGLSSFSARGVDERHVDARTPACDLHLHLERLHSVAHGILRCNDLAWDAVQEALVCLWTQPVEPSDVGGWLVRTVVHRSLHQARTRDRRHRHEALAPHGGAASDPCAAAGERDVLDQITAAAAELPEPFRTAFRLREFEGHDYGHIAAELGVPIGTVRSRLNRARAMLRERLAHLEHDERSCAVCAHARRR